MKPHKLLKTAQDHAAALERLDELMRLDPQPNSAEEDELELGGRKKFASFQFSGGTRRGRATAGRKS